MLVATDLSVVYRRSLGRKPIRALAGFSISVGPGEILALLGPNGAGKSTAMRCFLGLIRPDAGSVEVFGETPAPGARLFQQIGYLPEEPHYHSYLTVEEAVRYYAALVQDGVDEQRLADGLERVGLAAFRHLRIAKCSKGMKQKVGIVAALMARPRLLFLDEPTRGLDPIMVKEFRDLLVDLHGEGCTVVLNSHVLSEVEAVATRVAILSAGRLLVEGSLGEILPVDEENYEVTLSGTGAAPECFHLQSEEKGVRSGLVGRPQVGELFRAIEGTDLQVERCALRRPTLEEAFFQTLGRVAS